MNEIALARARKGYQFLNEHGSEDWQHRIDLNRLNVASDCDCVLGQLYGDFDVALERLELVDGEGNDDLAYECGFIADTLGIIDIRYSDLTEAWRFLLKEESDAD